MRADFTIHSGWGNHVEWLDDLSKIDLNKDTVRVYGHMPRKPKKGDTLIGEFQRSFIKFEFVSVEYPGDPPDMFFGDVKAIEQEMKAA
jgi:hypothetical protein